MPEPAPDDEVDGQGRPRLTWQYVVSTRVVGDSNVLVGVLGPGLVVPSSSITDVTSTHPGVGTIGASIDCVDPSWWSAKDSDYRVQARRTDQYGRVAIVETPLDGPTVIELSGRIRRACLPIFFRTLPAAVAQLIPAQRSNEVDFTLRLTNPTGHALWVVAPGDSDGSVATVPLGGAAWTSLSDAPWQSLPAGGTASLQLSFRAASCADTSPRVPHTRSEAGQVEDTQGVALLVASTPHTLDGEPIWSWAVFDPASAAMLDPRLGALCPPQD